MNGTRRGYFLYRTKGNRKVSLSILFNPSLFLPLSPLPPLSLPLTHSYTISLFACLPLPLIPSPLWVQTACQSSLTCPQSYLAIKEDPHTHVDPPKMFLLFINYRKHLKDPMKLTKQMIITETRHITSWWKTEIEEFPEKWNLNGNGMLLGYNKRRKWVWEEKKC